MKVNWMDNKLIQKELLREDKENIFVPALTKSEFIHLMIDTFLGENWYVSDPIGAEQVLYIAAHEILNKYSRKYRKEVKQYEKEFDVVCEGLECSGIPQAKELTMKLLADKLMEVKKKEK